MHKEWHDAHDEWIALSKYLTKTSLYTRLPSKNSSIQITLKACVYFSSKNKINLPNLHNLR
jgi:hypothetical protein